MDAPDYSTLIDAEIWAFIRKSQSFFPDDAVQFSLTELRAVYDRMCAAFRAPHPPGVTATDRPFGGVPCRIYESRPSRVTVMYFHGGGFVVGGLESHDDVCAEICAATGYRVVSVDYRLAPEHRHPAAFQDALAATHAVAAAIGPDLVLCGDSAGGNLASALAHRLRGSSVNVLGQVLIYTGMIEGEHASDSFIRHARAPMLTREDLAFYRKIRMPEDGGDPNDVTAYPMADPDFRGLPPSFLLSAECDPLADDGLLYARKVVAAGGKAHYIRARGLVHGSLRARHMSHRAGLAFGQITDAVAAFGRGEFPWSVSA